MEIIYQHNPLLNKVILNDTEKKLLFWKYSYVTQVGEAITSLSFYIDDYKNNRIKPSLILNETYRKKAEEFLANPLDKIHEIINDIENNFENLRYNETTIKYFIEALQESHFGDCINEPNSCLKCWAEDELDIVTMPNYPGGIGRSLYYAFNNPNYVGTIDEAIDFLTNREYANPGVEQKYVEGWKERDKKAKEYLIYYKKEVLGL